MTTVLESEAEPLQLLQGLKYIRILICISSRKYEGFRPAARIATLSRSLSQAFATLLGGSSDLVSRVISTLIGVISNYNYSYLTYNPSY